jgi:hypothetical protein
MNGNNPPATKADITQIATLIENLGESLQRELHALSDRFDSQSARLERHGGMLRGGSVQLTRLIEWSEKIDALLEERDRRIASLEERVQKLETQNPA